MRVGVRNRLGEAIGKPVANLHGRWTSAARVPREKDKKDTPVLRFSADRSTYRSNLFSFHFSSLRLSRREYREWRGSGRGTEDRKVFVRSKNVFRVGRIMSWILDSRNSISPSFIRIQSKLDGNLFPSSIQGSIQHRSRTINLLFFQGGFAARFANSFPSILRAIQPLCHSLTRKLPPPERCSLT